MDSLTEAIVEIESGGRSDAVGRKGERGLMQIKPDTWRAVTCRLFGRPISFARAFEPGLNRQVGLSYLVELRAFLALHRHLWQADERTLLVAAYNCGPGRLSRSDFDPDALPGQTRSYVERALALHDDFRR